MLLCLIIGVIGALAELFWRACFANSAIAPASSTPIGPATDDNGCPRAPAPSQGDYESRR
jgi:hypothetical protein